MNVFYSFQEFFQVFLRFPSSTPIEKRIRIIEIAEFHFRSQLGPYEVEWQLRSLDSALFLNRRTRDEQCKKSDRNTRRWKKPGEECAVKKILRNFDQPLKLKIPLAEANKGVELSKSSHSGKLIHCIYQR